MRERISRALALPRHADVAETDAAINRALATRQSATGTGAGADTRNFAEVVDSLQQARGEAAIVDAASALHQLERMLIR